VIFNERRSILKNGTQAGVKKAALPSKIGLTRTDKQQSRMPAMSKDNEIEFHALETTNIP
jgi:hypothetical protein